MVKLTKTMMSKISTRLITCLVSILIFISCSRLETDFEKQAVVFCSLDQKEAYLSVEYSQPFYSTQGELIKPSENVKIVILDSTERNLVIRQTNISAGIWKVDLVRDLATSENNKLIVTVDERTITSEWVKKPTDFRVDSFIETESRRYKITISDSLSKNYSYVLQQDKYKNGKLLNTIPYKGFFENDEEKKTFSFSDYYISSTVDTDTILVGGVKVKPDSVIVRVSKIPKQTKDFFRVWDEQSTGTRLGVYEYYGTYPFNMKGGGVGLFSNDISKKLKIIK